VATQTILVIRHAEKPGPGGSIGVSEAGKEDPNELSVRGWQRAGALTQLFRENSGRHPGIKRPDWLVAASPSGGYMSRRAISTLTPLSRLLDVPIERQFAPGDEAALVDRLVNLEGTTLVAWRHQGIPALAAHFMGADEVPHTWPDDRFDLMWLFTRTGTLPWRFAQLYQRLLDNDARPPSSPAFHP
jgi:hypothetical protein